MTEKKEFILEGLGCANCAAKMETQIKALPGVRVASVNFTTSTLAIEAGKDDIEKITAEARKIITRIEPHVVVREKEATHTLKQIHLSREQKEAKQKILRFAAGAVLFLVALLLQFPQPVESLLYGLSYVLSGGEVVLKAVRNIARGQVFDENFLMTAATAGAFAIKEYPEAVAVMLFYQTGELFQDVAVNRSRRSIQALMDIRPDFANLKKGEEFIRVNPEEVSTGEVILVKPGERVPLDGKVIEGNSLVDTSALTGESVPRDVKPGDGILSGSINTNGVLLVEVTKEYGESTVAKILDLVQHASSKKAPTENFITKFARYYTPGVVLTAAALAFMPPLFIPDAVFTDWLYRALIFLVVSCPCALVVSIPLGFFGGIGGAAKKGILIKGGNYLEALNNVDTVVFDKTGTLTKGVFKVTSVVPENGLSKEDLLEYAALAEVFSNHPIARSVLESFGREVSKERIDSYEEIAGQGVRVSVEGKTILAGNMKLLDNAGISAKSPLITGTIVHVAVDGKYAGYLVISDELKEDSARALEHLRNIGIKRLVMLTGDSEAAARHVAEVLKMEEVYAELLPHEKMEKLERIYETKGKGKLVFVGDGLNDAPVLARADIGVAMGGLGSDAAIEAADVVIMTDEPSKIAAAIKIAQRTRSIVWQNIIFALGVKGLVLLLGAGGMATMWEAVFADVGVAVIAILNAMRVMRTENM